MVLAQTSFEKRLAKFLTGKQPEPKYSLGARCRFSHLDEPRSGHIVGLYWVSVEYAFHNQLEPGWYYVVQSEDADQHHYLSESDISIIKSRK